MINICATLLGACLSDDKAERVLGVSFSLPACLARHVGGRRMQATCPDVLVLSVLLLVCQGSTHGFFWALPVPSASAVVGVGCGLVCAGGLTVTCSCRMAQTHVLPMRWLHVPCVAMVANTTTSTVRFDSTGLLITISLKGGTHATSLVLVTCTTLHDYAAQAHGGTSSFRPRARSRPHSA